MSESKPAAAAAAPGHAEGHAGGHAAGHAAAQLGPKRSWEEETGRGGCERKHGFSAEPVPVSAYVGSSKNLKDLKGEDELKRLTRAREEQTRELEVLTKETQRLRDAGEGVDREHARQQQANAARAGAALAAKEGAFLLIKEDLERAREEHAQQLLANEAVLAAKDEAVVRLSLAGAAQSKEAAGLRSASRACGERLLTERVATGREIAGLHHAGEVRERARQDELRLARQEHARELLGKEEALAAKEGVIAGLRREKDQQATPYILNPEPCTLNPKPQPPNPKP